jgi:hypothetical protein
MSIVRFCAWPIVILALPLFILFAYSRCAAVPELIELQRDQEQVQAQSEALARLRFELIRRRDLKDRVVANMLAGRLTLLEAAARFDALSKSLAPSLPKFFGLLPGETYEEQLCWCVISYAEAALDDQPARQALVVAQLQAELAAQLARNTTLVLPALPENWEIPS